MFYLDLALDFSLFLSSYYSVVFFPAAEVGGFLGGFIIFALFFERLTIFLRPYRQPLPRMEGFWVVLFGCVQLHCVKTTSSVQNIRHFSLPKRLIFWDGGSSKEYDHSFRKRYNGGSQAAIPGRLGEACRRLWCSLLRFLHSSAVMMRTSCC